MAGRFILLLALAGCAAHSAVPVDAGEAQDASGSEDSGIADAGVACPTTRVPNNHRVAPRSCDHMRLPPPDAGPFPDAGACSTDDECDGGTDGRCVFSATRDPFCSYDECFEDSDCSDGGVCSCRDEFTFGSNACLVGNCAVDADCGSCGFCSPSIAGCQPLIGVTGYYCHTATDECANDSDCTSVPGLSCIFSPPAGRWTCSPLDCTG